MAHCRTCGQSITWARTEAGKKIPLDHPPENRFVFPGDGDLVVVLPTYISHFATCPQADEHRKPREKPVVGSTEDYVTPTPPEEAT